MKKNNIYDALSGIDEKYLERSEDFQEIRSQFKRGKIHMAEKYISFAACLAFTVIVGLNIHNKNDIAQRSSIIGTSYQNEQQSAITKISTNTSKKTEYTSVLKENMTGISAAVLNTETSKTTVKLKATDAYIHTEPAEAHTDTVTEVPVKKPENTETLTVSETQAPTVTKKTSAATKPKEETDMTNIIITPIYNGSYDKDDLRDIDETISDTDWEDLKMYEKFDLMVFNDTNYLTNGTTIGANRLGEIIGNITLSGFDPYKYKTYYSDAEVFLINDIPETESVAVRFKEQYGYYLYTNADYFYDR